MNIKGLKITDIMDMDWNDLNKLTPSEMKQVTSRLVSAANKRIRRLEKAPRGTSSFAYQKVEEQGRKFSVRGKNNNQVKNEFKNVRAFLNYKTSTVKGWKEYREDMEQRVSGETGGESQEWSERTWEKYWKVYHRMDESHGGRFKKGDSDRIQQMIHEIFVNNDKRRNVDYFHQIVERKYSEFYESSEMKSKSKSPDQYFANGDETDKDGTPID